MLCVPRQRTAPRFAAEHLTPASSLHPSQRSPADRAQPSRTGSMTALAQAHAPISMVDRSPRAALPVPCCRATLRQLGRQQPPGSRRLVACAAEADGSAPASEAEEVDAAAIEGLNPMFNDQFSSVLKEALSRQGASSLFSGPVQADPPPDKRRPSALEDVLQAALQNSRRNLKSLEAVHGAVGDAIMRERKQFERLHFCLQKSVTDAAYQHTIEQLLEEKRAEISDYEADQVSR